jgi:hypothetical protein
MRTRSHSPNTHRRWRAVVVAVVVLLVGVMAAFGVAPADAASRTANGVVPRGEISPVPAVLPKSTEIVRFGFEPIQVHGVSLADDTWSMNFYMWWRWRGSIDPVTTTSFDNQNVTTASSKISYSYTTPAGAESPITLPDGEHYQLAYIQSAFADNFPLDRYPLDSQKLNVRFENTTYAANQVVYEPDTANVSTDKSIVIPDWTTNNETYSTYFKTYQTNFGYTAPGASYNTWSLGEYTIAIQRPASHFYLKLLLPLVVVMIAALSCLLIKAEHEISRLGIAATALLTLIFLQDAYSHDLPPNIGVVLLDKIYVVAYAAVVIVFARVIWETHQVFRHKRTDAEFIRADRIFAAGLGLVCALATWTIISL